MDTLLSRIRSVKGAKDRAMNQEQVINTSCEIFPPGDPKMSDQAKEYYLAILDLMQSGGKVGYLRIKNNEVEFVESDEQGPGTNPLQFPLSSIRAYKGYTEDEAAKYCGVPTEKMKEFEKNPGKIPVSVAFKLRKLYGIPIDYIRL